MHSLNAMDARTFLKFLYACALLAAFYLFDSCLALDTAAAHAANGRLCQELFSTNARPYFLNDSETDHLKRLVETAIEFPIDERTQVYEYTRQRFADLKIATRLITDAEGHRVVELLRFSANDRLSKIMRAASEKLGLRFFIDPFKNQAAGYKAEYSPEEHAITIDVFEIQTLRERFLQVLLHEIRHAYLERQKNAGLSNDFQGEVEATKGHRLGKIEIYDEFFSFEELSTYFKDAKVTLRQFKNGQASKQDLRKNLRELIEMTDLSLAHLGKLAKSTKPADSDFYRNKDEIPALIYKLKGQGKTKNIVIAEALFDLPEISYKATVGEAHEAVQKRVARLIEIAKVYKAFAESELSRLH